MKSKKLNKSNKNMQSCYQRFEQQMERSTQPANGNNKRAPLPKSMLWSNRQGCPAQFLLLTGDLGSGYFIKTGNLGYIYYQQ